MDIVSNPQKSREIADEVAKETLLNIIDTSCKFIPEDDPSEYIYLMVHIIGNIMSKMAISLEGYAKIYGIHDMNIKIIKEWIVKIEGEYTKAYKQENRE